MRRESLWARGQRRRAAQRRNDRLCGLCLGLTAALIMAGFAYLATVRPQAAPGYFAPVKAATWGAA